jgi:hypothetical protein
MCRISPVNEDWADKGCHVHVGKVEMALRPDHQDGVVFRPVFSKTPAPDVDVAARQLAEMLDDQAWREKLMDTIDRAMRHLLGIEGHKYSRARGRLRELRMLIIALERRGKN